MDIAIVYVVACISSDPPYYDSDNNQGGMTLSFWAAAILNGIHLLIDAQILLLIFQSIIRTRQHIRTQYAIPEQDCIDDEDYCYSYFCACCVVAQMDRHIRDYHEPDHQACCCCGSDCSGTGYKEQTSPH